MEHIKNVRNYKALKEYTSKANGVNHLCGDSFKVFLEVKNRTIKDVSFECECCGISMASASLMTEIVKGKNLDVVLEYLDEFMFFVNHGKHKNKEILREFKKTFGIISTFPSRKSCASLGWITLKAAIDGKDEAVV